ncbi:MAG: hypothetical protein OXT09_23910, partial [Myxococcales bacterium]|nr:hypothetical protein [Myxococcales bacterium]
MTRTALALLFATAGCASEPPAGATPVPGGGHSAGGETPAAPAPGAQTDEVARAEAALEAAKRHPVA